MKLKISKRHLAKTITWRIIGTIDTIVLSWIISGSPLAGFKIGFTEVITKMLLYYFHERLWFRVNLPDSRKRHLLKTVSWRMVGTIDTMIIAWVITGNPVTGMKIGAFEIFTKMLLYYLHERGWYRLNYGLESERRTSQQETEEIHLNKYEAKHAKEHHRP